jgi:hypothetical protein
MALPPLLFALPVILLFFWWLAGAIVRYSRWQDVPNSQWTTIFKTLGRPAAALRDALERSALIRWLDTAIAAVRAFEKKIWGDRFERRPDARAVAESLQQLLKIPYAGLIVAIMLFPHLPLLLVRWLLVGPFKLAAALAEWIAETRPWQFYWIFMLLFYGYVMLDPLDSIHPVMARKGLAPAPNLVEMIGNGQFIPIPLFQFQWGYFLLTFLFWFLVITASWSYLSDGMRELWFHAKRLRRYGVSVLLGFRETARLARSVPVTRDYPRTRPALPPVYRGIPRLNVEGLTAAEAAIIRAADSSAAISSPPGQPDVLFVDLGVYDFSPALAEAKRADGTCLLSFTDFWPAPETLRENLVIPLAGPLPSFNHGSVSAAGSPVKAVDGKPDQPEALQIGGQA